MKTVIDILKRTAFMAFFFMPIPLGSYIIHSGSSAVVALISFLMLSLAIPLGYLSFSFSGFGPQEMRVSRWAYIVAWLLVQAGTYYGFVGLDFAMLWHWPTVGRDLAFVLIMYGQVALSLLLAFAIGRPFVKEAIHE